MAIPWKVWAKDHNPTKALFILNAAGFFIFLLGVLVLFGWFNHINVLIQFKPTYVPMAVNTAVSFVLLGIGMLLYERHILVTEITSGLVLLISSFTIFEYIFNIDLGIDNFILEPYLVMQLEYPGRMAPNTALYFVISSLLMIGPEKQGDRFFLFKLTLSLFLIVASSIAVTGYITHIPASYTWSNYVQMAIHTALGFLIIGIVFLLYLSSKINLILQNKFLFRPYLIIAFGSAFFIILWQFLVKQEQLEINKTTESKGYYIRDLLSSEINSQALSIIRMKNRLENGAYQNNEGWKKDAQSYLRDFPVIEAFELIHHQDIVGVYRFPNARKLISSCKNDQLGFFLVGKKLPDTYLCIVLSVDQSNKGERLKTIINIDKIFTQIINTNQLNNYFFEFTGNKKVIFSNIPKNQPRHVNNAVLIPIKNKYLCFDILVWPSFRTTLQLETFFPLLALISGLIITELLAYAVWMLQLLVTHRKKLKESESQLKKVLDTTSDAIIIVNEQGNVHLSNLAAAKLFKYTKKELLGKAVESLIPLQYRVNIFIIEKII